eukprot:scaffold439565_cov38-Prasinocladus_malaysianus.AAC.1
MAGVPVALMSRHYPRQPLSPGSSLPGMQGPRGGLTRPSEISPTTHLRQTQNAIVPPRKLL